MMKKLYLALALIICQCAALKAQQDISLLTLNNVFQQSYVNPSYIPQSYLSIGLPGSSVYARVSNTGFTFGELINTGGTKTVSIDKLVDGLGKKNLLAADVAVDLFSLGFKFKSLYISFSASQHVNTSFIYPKDMALLFTRGNGDESVIGRTLSLDGLGFNLSVYQQYAASLAFPVGEKLKLGVRGKYLSGLANITTEKSKLGITTNADDYSISLNGAFALNTSGIGNLEREADGNLAAYFQESLTKPGAKNSGYAIDLGAEFAFSERITLGASLLNLGYINWDDDVKKYSNDNINYQFKGLDIRNLSEELITKEVDNQLDTLKKRFSLNESTGKYSARLNPQILASANLKISESNSVGLIARSELVGSILRPSLSAYYQFKINHWFGATVNYSYLNKSFFNLGGGLVIKALPFQIYIASDNFLAPIALSTAKGFQIRTGINLAFGGKEVKKISIPEFEGGN